MDEYEFSPLREEYAPPAEEPSPPGEFSPLPEEFPVIYSPGAETGKKRSVLKKLMLLSAAFMMGGMLFHPFAAGPLLPGIPVKPQEPQGPQEPMETVITGPASVAGFTDPEITIDYAVLEEEENGGRTLSFSYKIFRYDAASVSAYIRAEDASGRTALFQNGTADLWEGSRNLFTFSMDVTGLQDPVTLVVDAAYDRRGEAETVTASRVAVPAPPAPRMGADFTLSGDDVDYMAWFAPAPEDSSEYQLSEAFLFLRWYREQPDGSLSYVGGKNVDGAYPEAVPGSEGWLLPYRGPSFLDGAPEGVTHFSYELNMVDLNTMRPYTIETEPQALPQPEEEPYYPRETVVYPLEGDRMIFIHVFDDADLQFLYAPDGTFVGTTSNMLLELSIAEKDFTGLELPMPKMQEGFRFLGYVMCGKGGSEEEGYFEYTEFVGLDLSPEEASHAPLVDWENPETGERGTSRYIELHDMWLYGGGPEDEDPYLLTLDANGGEYPDEETGESATEITYNVRSPLYSSTMCWTGAFPEPVRRGFRFTGWYRTPDCEGEPVEVVYGDEFYPMTEPVPGAMTSVEEFDAQYDFTADDFDWDAYYTAYGEFLSALGGRDWSTVIPVTLYAGWEKVDPQLSPP